MKHCIIAKYTPEAYPKREELLPRIREIFSTAGDIPGVHGAEVLPNWDASDIHHRWKDEFGPLLEKKAIFDYE